MTAVWPWLVLAGLGAFHGLNPAMGWLFAVALGLHRRNRSVVLLALVPIAIGHFLSIVVVVALFLLAGAVVDADLLRRACGLLLIAWAAYFAGYGHCHRVRFGMQVGMAGLAAWSFLMATAHGAGLMLIPALMPICYGSPSTGPAASGTIAWAALAAVLVHSAAMLTVTGLVALIVYDWLGLAILRTAWINVDRIWALSLSAIGLVLLFG